MAYKKLIISAKNIPTGHTLRALSGVLDKMSFKWPPRIYI